MSAQREGEMRSAQREGALKRRPQRGFTLLEVMMAMAILGTAIVALLGLHARNMAATSDAQTLMIAATLASDVLAIARLDPELEEGEVRGRFAALRSRADGRTVLYGGAMSERFVWTREVLPTALPTLKQIRVQIAVSGDEQPVTELWAALRAPVPGR